MRRGGAVTVGVGIGVGSAATGFSFFGLPLFFFTGCASGLAFSSTMFSAPRGGATALFEFESAAVVVLVPAREN